MKTHVSRRMVGLVVLSLTISPMLAYGTDRGFSGVPAPDAVVINTLTEGTFSEAELDELLGPIALYPDPLLAQVLPAATFIDQLDEAQKLLKGKADDDVIAKQSWDISVKAVAHYPPVLQSMTQKHDWTIALGQAYVSQPSDVETAIQRLRAEASAAGNLVSNDKMTVETKTESGKEVIVVEPAKPEVIYVPTYNPQVVYVQSGPSTGAVMAASALAFGAGLAMGAWLNRGWRWYGGGPYYHGWVGAGWIGRSASHVTVNVNRNVYINNSYSNINVNRSITTRNINTYRNEMNRTAELHREQKVSANRARNQDTPAAKGEKLQNRSGAGGNNRAGGMRQSAGTGQNDGNRAGGAKSQTNTMKGGAAGGGAGAKAGGGGAGKRGGRKP